MEICKKIVSWKIVSKNDDEHRPQKISFVSAPKRPLELICDINKVKVQGAQWTIFVGLLNGDPYEVFGGLSKYIDIPNKYKTGKIIKNGKIDGLTTYNLVIGEDDDQMIIKDISNVFENKIYGAFTRVLSLALRHGTPVQFTVEQLLKDKHSEMASFSKVVARVLKLYIKDGTASSEKKCPNPNCDGTLVYKGGCVSCKDCGYEKCS